MSEIKYFTLKFSKKGKADIIKDCCFDPSQQRTYPYVSIKDENGDSKVIPFEPESALQHVRSCVREARRCGYKFDGFVRGAENKLEKLSSERILMMYLFG